MSSNYSTDIGDLNRDKAQALRLWGLGLGAHREQSAEQKFAHMYVDNPAGQGKLFFLSENSSAQQVGVQGLVIRQFQQNNTALTAHLMADFVVDPKHRSLGPAIRLLESVVNDGSDDASFTYGYPNKSSEPVLKRAGYSLLGSAVRFARPLATPASIIESAPQWLAPLISSIGDTILKLLSLCSYLRVKNHGVWDMDGVLDESANTLWKSANLQDLTISKRGLSELQWRYRLNESNDWRIFTARTKTDGGLIGYVVWKDNNGVAYIGDFFTRDRSATLAAMLRAFTWHASKAGCRSISLEFSGCPIVAAKLQAAGFRVREEEPIYCIMGGKQQDYSPWYLTAFDRDT